MKNQLFLILLVGVVSIFRAAPVWSAAKITKTTEIRKVSSVSAFDHSHRDWSAFLKKQVTVKGQASTVNYKVIKSDPKDLIAYINSLESVTLDIFNSFSENEKLAFLINAYNAFTIKLIVDNYPVKSIKDIGSILTSPWKIKFFSLFGERRNLDNVEHDMIRKWFNEPRIHFAVVCASVGCPSLKNEAYVAAQLDKQLEEASLNFLSDSSRNRYLSTEKKLELSSIFKWYGGDFVKKFGSLEVFIAPRITSSSSDQAVIREKNASVSYLDYDWSLNEEK